MDTKIEILTERNSPERLLTIFEMLSLSNGYSGQKQLTPLNGESDLIFVGNEEVSKLDVLCTKSNLFLKLKQINVSGCGLTEIPSTVFTLKYLTVLNLSNNLLDCLPKELGNLHNLTILKLTGNKLSSLPKSLKSIQQLNYLDLSCNKFFEVPNVLYYGLRTLKVLNLSCNLLTQFNDPPACLNTLIMLGLANNILNQLPLWIFNNLCQLQFLDLSENQLGLGVELIYFCSNGIFRSLQVLNIENCNYNSENIKIFSHCRNLKVLYCGNKKSLIGRPCGRNYFGNLNVEAFKNLKEITDLYLQNVGICTLPSDFDYFENIVLLDLSGNNLSWLPESFCKLTTLKILNLTSNQLLFLPSNIGNLVNLQQIHLSNNKLYHIPESFYDLISLQFIDLYDNEINKINPSIFKDKNLKGIDLGLNFLQFGFGENGVDIDELGVLYNCLKDSFRKHFGCTDSRSDLQKIHTDYENKPNSDSTSRCSSNSFESEKMSDVDESSTQCAVQSYTEEENWEKEDSCVGEADEFFDPNEWDIFRPQRKSWSLEFINNYCPAKYHASPVVKSYFRNFKMASPNEVAEGQFDSD